MPIVTEDQPVARRRRRWPLITAASLALLSAAALIVPWLALVHFHAGGQGWVLAAESAATRGNGWLTEDHKRLRFRPRVDYRDYQVGTMRYTLTTYQGQPDAEGRIGVVQVIPIRR